ncbi:NAD(P)/FAD-dependent oxidoreductase [Flavihumibacter petaseus]|uniref:Putative oxidoreductase n=1 Tax=Flavihumibacter petaseus NBRC 106054 TaxID=1220578 RepID=A0A0E9MXK1_9BACT|nr:FAD-dependent oxidoreductase [Flavihumibacter petaseus]GAO42427.1 putative oxidoreductase [Flavihumibacter petaseus NBRC 106054]
MDLRSHSPYWLLKSGLPQTYPSLPGNSRVDIAVMGAGISGALTAWYLAEAGFKVIVLDKRHAGTGSTAASTALLQYEIDTPLVKLAARMGEAAAVRAYKLTAEAISKLEWISTRVGKQSTFTNRPSLQYASRQSHVKDLREEFRLRRAHGFPVYWWDAEKLSSKMGFLAPAGLYSTIGAELDAYLLTHQLLKKSQHKGARIYDNTTVTHIHHDKKGVTLHTDLGFTVKAKELVIACGYESQRYIPFKVEQIHSTYAMVSEPMPGWQSWYRRCLIWETATPYLYLRSTDDKRILVGGLDDDFYQPDKRDARISDKTRRLVAAFHRKFPEIPFRPDFQWAGAFASTKDGLPYIGAIRQRPHTHFALGFGGNGITFSVLAAEIIRDTILGKPRIDNNIFSFNR